MDRYYDANWLRGALKSKGIRARIPGRKQRKKTVKSDKRQYKRRNRIEIMFGRHKDWRRVATRHDRCLKVFLSAISLAALVIFRQCVSPQVKHNEWLQSHPVAVLFSLGAATVSQSFGCTTET
jgi:IS5 family transposase